jgi:hypothetical protein
VAAVKTFQNTSITPESGDFGKLPLRSIKRLQTLYQLFVDINQGLYRPEGARPVKSGFGVGPSGQTKTCMLLYGCVKHYV